LRAPAEIDQFLHRRRKRSVADGVHLQVLRYGPQVHLTFNAGCVVLCLDHRLAVFLAGFAETLHKPHDSVTEKPKKDQGDDDVDNRTAIFPF
jgi:hypothetical protein